MAFLPRGPANHEEIVVDVRPHWSWLIGPAFRLAIVLSLSVAALAWLTSVEGTEAAQLLVVAVGVLVSVRYCVWPAVRWATTRYVLTTERLVINAGVVRRSAIEMPLSRVGDIESHSSLSESIFGCGTLIVAAAGGREVLELPRTPKVSVMGQTLNQLSHSD